MTLRKYQSKNMVASGMSVAILAGAGALLGARPASAQEVSGPTEENGCMQSAFDGGKLNCTAKDVRLSRAVSVSPATCTEGETIDLTATFETIVTANTRYDIGFWFRTDGGDDARGDDNAVCSISALDPAKEPGVSIDTDSCGDLTSGTYENVTFTIPDVLCEAAPGTDVLKLPNCTSWHNSAGNDCAINPSSPTNPIPDPSDFAPETKSKCTCDDTFTVPVIVVPSVPPTLLKTALSTADCQMQVDATYTVVVTNNDPNNAQTVTALTDNKFGDISTAHGPSPGIEQVVSTNCTVPRQIPAGEGNTTTCSFVGRIVQNSCDFIHTDTVTGTVRNAKDEITSPSDSADVTVSTTP
ncbi:hypothetical protein [Nannocystis sp. SCPEA4]|uniref:hypothetical protein n=1 Tax=Nannocystis sp. SCPEA4 TaxID=2996787 RepID=UPI00226EAEF7|nr:hypothetical protein [Nannocystis sp. SCPEA4]MCY1055137.1 hypothetical protein [Nannocystis sp. SCPEA4]